jgi:molybdenum cofactor biosynthesis enzyme MoaA
MIQPGPGASTLVAAAPMEPFEHLDALWIQVAGTLCNLACTHCLVSAGPGVDRHGFMSRTSVRERVAEAVALGVREIYFTGGEPFLHPEMTAILLDTLAVAPCTVLTNGTLFPAERIGALAALARDARYALELRVSLDGDTAGVHDAIRGAGAFARALDGICRCHAAGLLPIVTVTHGLDDDPLAVRTRFDALLRTHGVRRPRIKLMPLFRIGREVERSGAYGADDTLAGVPQDAIDPDRLQCGRSRAVSTHGVFACPILVDEPAARLAADLASALGPIALAHPACLTCHVTGMTCGNG